MLIMLLQVLLMTPAIAAMPDESCNVLLDSLYKRIKQGDFNIGEARGHLYVKQYVDVERKNIFLNIFPDMTRFDKGEKRYLSELYYDVFFPYYTVPEISRRAYLTTHRHGSGEMKRVMAFMRPDIFDETLFEGKYLSPLHKRNRDVYDFSVGEEFVDGCIKLCFKQRIDNIKLFEKGWLLLDSSGFLCEFYAEGWDEQGRFNIYYKMGDAPGRRTVVEAVTLVLDYDFLGNKLKVTADGRYNYTDILPLDSMPLPDNPYNLTSTIEPNVMGDTLIGREQYIHRYRAMPLTSSDSLFYIEKGVLFGSAGMQKSLNNGIDFWLWSVGDQMLSSRSMEWNDSEIKMSPILNPSYLDYSSSRGLSYRIAFNFYTALSKNRELRIKPVIGYNFKQGAFYWKVAGRYLFDPLHLGAMHLELGAMNNTYSSLMLQRIEDMALDSLNFEDLKLNYFRNHYINVDVSREIANGLELLAGVNFHARRLIGDGQRRLESEGFRLKKQYSQFAPHIRITWHPGMYYYMRNNRKVNLGSKLPRFSFDIEQGVSGLFGARSIYTSAELDIQYKLRVNESDNLYLRVGGGGFFYTKDLYFVDYAFLKPSNLPVDRSDKLGGVFQLLDSEWYNSANKYFRANATYESPFMMLQKMMPRVNFLQNEKTYFNLLIMSQLLPYTEIGYGVETPYLDLGVFVSLRNTQFYKVGYKISVSLFRD